MSDDQLLNERYRVGRLIGHGGMGDVYLGTDTRLGRTVAIKLLRPQLSDDPTFQKRFRNETVAAARMINPHIVRTFDAGQDLVQTPNGKQHRVPYLVMEYVEGRTLKTQLQHGPMPFTEAISVMDKVLRALEYSHRTGIVHRDIKPGNIMLADSGQVKVMDFGVARAISESESTVAKTGTVVGTALYFSPEQAKGEHVDGRSDIYSATVVLYQMVTGRPPFRGDSAASVAYQHVNATAPTVTALNHALPQDMNVIIEGGMAKNPDERYQTAEEMRADLQRVARGERARGPRRAATAQTAVMPAAGAEESPLADFETDDTQVGKPPLLEKRFKRGTIGVFWAIVIGVGALALGAFLWLAFMRSSVPPQDPHAVVPNVSGSTFERAQQTLEDRGFQAERAEETSDTVDEGRVTRTDPGQNAYIATGSTVKVFVSSGKPKVDVPELVGLSERAARSAIQGAGLELGAVSQQVNDEVPEGQVVASTPAQGKSVDQGSTVNLVISTGTTRVPRVSGLTVDEAQKELEDAGLKSRVQRKSSCNGGSGSYVWSQDPAAGSEVTGGTTVTLTVYVQATSGCRAPQTGAPSEGSGGDGGEGGEGDTGDDGSGSDSDNGNSNNENGNDGGSANNENGSDQGDGGNDDSSDDGD